jgi:1,4-dihydroxy-6-naphthoate synthase
MTASATSTVAGKRRIRVGHSPDPDDAFMFYALAHDKIDCGPYEFVHQLEDIETLNRRAQRGELEVSAVSIHAYPRIADRYALLPSGASMGDGYGPMVVAAQPLAKEALQDCVIAVPGVMTSAFLALKLWLGCEPKYEVVPFDRILDAVKDGRFPAGLIIHEGQLTFARNGLSLVVDLGAWWKTDTGLPLPLGGNVVRKDLGPAAMRDVARLIHQSIRYALEHRDAALTYALQYGRDLDKPLADRFVGMYVNDWTLDYGPKGRAAIELFLQRGVEAGFVNGPIAVEFVDV